MGRALTAHPLHKLIHPDTGTVGPVQPYQESHSPLKIFRDRLDLGSHIGDKASHLRVVGVHIFP